MRRTVAIVAAVLVFAPSAHAGGRVERATALAETVWKLPPGTLEVRFEDPAAAGVRPDACGWAREGVPVVHINPACEVAQHWPTLCHTVLHEAGHVAHFRDPLNLTDPHHSHRAGSVMAAYPTLGVTRGRVVSRRGKVGPARLSFTGVDRRCASRVPSSSSRRSPGSAGRRARR